jgi:hypothetical protein
MDKMIGKLVRFETIVPLLGIITETDEHWGEDGLPGVKVLFWTKPGWPAKWYYFDTIEGEILDTGSWELPRAGNIISSLTFT